MGNLVKFPPPPTTPTTLGPEAKLMLAGVLVGTWILFRNQRGAAGEIVAAMERLLETPAPPASPPRPPAPILPHRPRVRRRRGPWARFARAVGLRPNRRR